MNIIPVILSGGSGTRLWPLSRNSYPKQFLSLVSRDESLFQSTVQRVRGISDQSPIVVCNEQHRFLVAEQLRLVDVPGASIVLEPMGKNTAPAAALAALLALEAGNGESPVLLVLPSDHLIQSPEAFSQAINTGMGKAADGDIVTFGIVPQHPETGYGYIKADTQSAGLQPNMALPIEKFVEKPDRETAEAYLETQQYLWNSGIFLFRADRFLEELKRHQSAILDACKASMEGRTRDLDFIRPDKTAFSECPSDSIDYAVMEHTTRATVVPMDAGWSDVGSWSSLWEVKSKDDRGNVAEGDTVIEDSEDCMVYADHRLVATLGLKDTIIVETADAVLVADKSRVQDIKKVVESLSGTRRYETDSHRKIYRPWGCFDSIDAGDRFQVKRITVNPGAKLSLQKHFHRAEHWIVVTGTAKITRNDEEFILTENQSTYIPLGAIHRLSNPGAIPLEIIEIQSGSYLGEDDIVRLGDEYGRSSDN